MPRRNNNRIQLPKKSNNQLKQSKALTPNHYNPLIKLPNTEIHGWHYLQGEEISSLSNLSLFKQTENITSNLGGTFEMINIQEIKVIP